MSEQVTEQIVISTGSSEVTVPGLVERIAEYVAQWGRKSDEFTCGCDHPFDEFCEQYGCTSFVELAEDIRNRFGTLTEPPRAA